MKEFTFRLERCYKTYETYRVQAESREDLLAAISSHGLDPKDGEGEGEQEMVDWEAHGIEETTND